MDVRSSIGLLLLLLALGLACSAELPEPKRCNSDAQCDLLPGETNSYQCVKGLCEIIQTCTSNANCSFPAGECVFNQCIRTDPCTSDAQCPAGKRCLDKHCVRVRVSEDLLVLHLKFEQGKENPEQVLDSSSRQHHGLWRGGGGFVETGYLGMAGRFDDEKARVVVPEHEDFKSLQVTATAWVKRNGIKGGGSVLRFLDDNLRNGYALEINGTGQVTFFVADGNGRHSCTGSSTIPAGQWVQIGGSFDGNLVRCFVNGRLDASSVWSGNPTYETTRELVIGGPNVEGDLWQGLIDEIKVYPLAQREAFSPDLARFLYVANEDASTIMAIDTVTDQPAPKQHFSSPLPGSWPVAMSNSGKFLYLWEPKQGQLAMLDLDTKKILASATAPGGGGWKDGVLATYLSAENEIWVWGNHLHVFPAFFAEQARPIATINGLGESFAADITLLPKKKQLIATHTEKRQLIFFDIKKRQQAAILDLNATSIAGKQPLAIASLPSEGNFYVSFADSSELKKYQLDGATNLFKETGAYTTKETVPDANGKDVVKARKIKRMIALPEASFLYYTFDEPRLVYYQDVVTALQFRLGDWIDQSQTQAVSRTLEPLSSQYYPHLHYLGQKLYFQAGNSGRFVVVDTITHKILNVLNLGSPTANQRLPIVGIRHHSQPY